MGVSGGCRYNKSELLFVSCALTHSANGQAHHTTTIATDARLNQPGSFVRVVADSPRTQQLSRVLQHHRLLQVLCDPFASCRPCLRFDLCALLAMTQVTTERIQSRTHARCDVAGARNTFYENMVRVLLSDLLSSRLAFHLESLSHVYTLPHNAALRYMLALHTRPYTRSHTHTITHAHPTRFRDTKRSP